jgi:predicted DNA-binding protein YlxM (UPF0122 family)
MSELDQARERKAALYQRYKQARAALLDAADAGERARQRERVRMLKEMYQEACQEVTRLDPERAAGKEPAGRHGKKPVSQVDTALACGALWSDLEGTAWSAVEGARWDALPATGRQSRQVQQLVSAGMALCTPLQAQCLHDYYVEELTQEEIGQRRGVARCTVSRVLKRGRERVETYVTAKLLLGRCVDGRGLFDYQLFLNSAKVLTERQKELVYLVLARDTSYRDIAGYLDRATCTVSHGVERLEEKLRVFSVDLDPRLSAVGVKRVDWAARREKELAEDLGLTPAFYYGVVCRGKTQDELPLLYCAILDRLDAGESIPQAARSLGCSDTLVRRVRRDHGDRPRAPLREDYRPKRQRRARPPENPFAALGGGDAILDRIDADTYRRLQERFGGQGHADP